MLRIKIGLRYLISGGIGLTTILTGFLIAGGGLDTDFDDQRVPGWGSVLGGLGLALGSAYTIFFFANWWFLGNNLLWLIGLGIGPLGENNRSNRKSG